MNFIACYTCVPICKKFIQRELFAKTHVPNKKNPHKTSKLFLHSINFNFDFEIFKIFFFESHQKTHNSKTQKLETCTARYQARNVVDQY